MTGPGAVSGPAGAVPESTVDGASRSRVGAHRPPGRAGRLVLVLAVAGMCLVAAGVAAALRSRPAPTVGSATVSRLASAATPATGPAATTGSRVPVVSGALPATSAPVVRPVRLEIPAIGVRASVRPTGVDASGEFDVPPSVDVVGWYRFGPGLTAGGGSVVIAGHVDSATQGAGAFFRLRELSPGDRVTVIGSDGRGRGYRVVAREIEPKATIRLDRYFDTTGPPRLTLMTCGGPFDRATRNYRDNVVVTAVPA